VIVIYKIILYFLKQLKLVLSFPCKQLPWLFSLCHYYCCGGGGLERWPTGDSSTVNCV